MFNRIFSFTSSDFPFLTTGQFSSPRIFPRKFSWLTLMYSSCKNFLRDMKKGKIDNKRGSRLSQCSFVSCMMTGNFSAHLENPAGKILLKNSQAAVSSAKCNILQIKTVKGRLSCTRHLDEDFVAQTRIGKWLTTKPLIKLAWLALLSSMGGKKLCFTIHK